jgi:ABC-2 type transport system permease protein
MASLLYIEWLKIKRYLTFWVLIALFALILPLWNYAVSHGFIQIGNGDINVLNKVYSFQYIWENIGFWTSLFVIFLSVLVIILTTNEYQFRTNRQNIIDGLTRLQFFHGKWIMVISLSILTTLYVFIVGVLFAANNGSMSEFPGHIEKLFYVFVLTLNYYSFSLLLSFFFKRSGITMGIFFLYCMFIETLMKSYVNYRFETNIGNYMPLQCSDELLPFPILDLIKSLAKMDAAPNSTPYLVASFVWIIIYYIIGRIKLMRSDW